MNEGAGGLRKRRVLAQSTYQNLAVLMLILIISIAMTFLSDKFATYSNFLNIMTQASITIMAGSVITLIIVSGNFDLSIGGIMGMSGVLFAYVCRAGVPAYPWAVLVALAPCLVMGLLNGVFVKYLNVPSFISTMGMMFVSRGIGYILAKGANIATGLPYNFTYMGTKTFLNIPLPVVYTVVILLVMWFVQSKTSFGRKIFAIGANNTAAKLSGINSEKITIVLYMLSGLIAGFCGVMYASRITSGDCTIGQGFEFQVIIAAVLGGTDVAGGRGSVTGMFLGAILLRILANGLNLLGMISYYQDVINGVVLLGAVVLNKYIIRATDRLALSK